MATTAEPHPATSPEENKRPTIAKAWGASAADQPLRPMEIERRALRPDDVAIRITYAGICHSDLHQCRNDWNNSTYPVVPGHEIIGEVTAVGPKVSKYKVGDIVAVGTIVDADLTCRECVAGWEQFCLGGSTLTYNGVDKIDGSITYGGYSDHVIVREHFVFRVPDGLDASKAAPLLCAGITTWSPLRQYPEHVGPGKEVAVAGLGGLGHLGVKFAAALGARVTMITTSPEKAADARALGAHDVLISRNPGEMEAANDVRNRREGLLPSVGRKQTPLLGKGGVAARSNKYCEATSLRADGVVRSTTSRTIKICGDIEPTTPSAPFK